MKTNILFLLFLAVVIGSCTQRPSSSGADSGNQNKETTDETSTESDIQFIRDKYEIISNETSYKTVPFKTQCDERSSTILERKYNKKGELSYLKYEECGEHGCSTKHHYYWGGELIFIFHKNDSTPGNSHIIVEHRSYFKNGKMIRCLEKEAHYHPGQPPIEELLANAENKEVICTPEKRSTKLSEIESLSLDEAQKYFCSASPIKMLDTFNSADCTMHFEMKAFDYECIFSANGECKEPAVFTSNMKEKACVKVNGELNALYPDWEERDYKKELKELSSAKQWISIDGEKVSFFGKPLSFYKYESVVEFLTDVILTSGRSIDKIPLQSSTSNQVVRGIETQVEKAIAKAKEFKAKGGDDPLTIVKFDNRAYDVFLRYRQTTQFEGEANHYEGKITLLKNRGAEILETKLLKGTCGC